MCLLVQIDAVIIKIRKTKMMTKYIHEHHYKISITYNYIDIRKESLLHDDRKKKRESDAFDPDERG